MAKRRSSQFATLTYSRYRDMQKRILQRYGLPLPFPLEDLRELVLYEMGSVDGPLRCPYCAKFCALGEIALDHAMPLSRGGSIGLENIEFPCKSCNAAKGSLSHQEFAKLLGFLQREIPLGRTDVLRRLTISLQLAAGTAYRRKKARAA